MSKWKWWGYPKTNLRPSDNFEFAIQNSEWIEIARKIGRDIVQGIYFEACSMESCT